MIDPGHGGIDNGASGNGLKEKDLTLDISKRINSYLNANYEVSTKMTRSNDATVSLNQRTNIANQWGADLFLSIHINAGGGTGYEDYIHGSFGPRSIKRFDTTSPKVQAAIRAEVNKVLDKHGVRDRGAKQANFHVLRESVMPAVLLEIMFIDTKSDADSLKSNRFKQDMANGISKGVAKAYKLKAKNKPTPKPDNIWTSKDTNEYLVISNKLNIRSGNSTKHSVLGSITKNKTIKAIGKTSNNWIKFKYKGKDAFVSGTLLKDKPKTSKPSKGKTYQVKPGDTLYSISVKHNVSVNNLKKWNKLKSNAISVNQKLKVSNKSTSKPSKPKPTPKPDNIWTSKDTNEYLVISNRLNIRSGNSTKHSVLGSITKNKTIKAIGKTSNNWIKFKYKGKDAFVSGTLLKDKPKTSKPSKGKTYQVKPGDTLYSISVKHNVSVNNLKKWNKLKSNAISVNQKLKVSNKSLSKPSKTTKYKTTATLLNVRNKASVKNSKVIARLPKNSTVHVIKKHNSYWYQIKYNGKNAYVSSKHIK